MKKYIIYLLTIISSLFIFFVAVPTVNAQSCTGGRTCCNGLAEITECSITNTPCSRGPNACSDGLNGQCLFVDWECQSPTPQSCGWSAEKGCYQVNCTYEEYSLESVACEAEPPADGYSCTDPASGTCTLVSGGPYSLQSTCEDTCGDQTWSCDTGSYTCSQNGGPYETEGDCTTACQEPPDPSCGGSGEICEGSTPYCCDPDGAPFCSSVPCGQKKGCDDLATRCAQGYNGASAAVPGADGTGTCFLGPGKTLANSLGSVFNPDTSQVTLSWDCSYEWSYSLLIPTNDKLYLGMDFLKTKDPGDTCSPEFPYEVVQEIGNNTSGTSFYDPNYPTEYGRYVTVPRCGISEFDTTCGAKTYAKIHPDVKDCKRPLYYCTPTCGANACGGSDGCGGTCSDIGNGSPVLVTINQPTANPVVLPSGSTTFTVSWTNTDVLTDSYDFVVFNPSVYLGDPVVAAQNAWAAGNNANVYSGTSSPIDSTSFVYDFTTLNLSPVVIAVRPVNSTCSVQNGGWTAIPRDIVQTAKITGTVYEGIGEVSGNYCQEVSGSEWNGGAGMSVSVAGLNPGPDPNGTTNVDEINGQYESGVIQENSGTAVVSLNNIPDGYTLTCPDPNAYYISTLNMIEDATGVNFFITRTNTPWWQTRSGLVHAQVSIGNNLPWFDNIKTNECEAAVSNCSPFLITANLIGVDLFTSGIPTAGVTFDAKSADYPTELDLGGDPPYVSGHSDAGITQSGYAQLSSRYDLSVENITASTIASKPTGGSVQGGDATIYFASGDLTIAPSSDYPWEIVSGEKIVIFVDGDVVMDGGDAGPYITVEEGGFFAVIASRDLRFNEAMGHEIHYGDGSGTLYNLVPNIEGVYVADGTLTVSDYWTNTIQDLKFVGAGSFIGLSGVSLPRDFEADDGSSPNLTGLLNNSVPTDTFIFRPDFVLNTPELMKKSTFTWQEINQLTP